MTYRSFKTPLSVALVAGVACTGVALAQTKPMPAPLPAEPEAIIYRDSNYSGPAVAIQREQRNLGLNWRVSSIRVPSGEWQLCSQANFRGSCVTITADRPRLGVLGRGLQVQSVRYVGGWQGLQPGDGGQSLRGMASQYYAMPMLYGQPVNACARGSATANCAAQTADSFCRDMGWRVSVHQRMETQGSRIVLRDVLCANADM